MTESELKARIKQGNLGGCYILTGEEDYLKRYYLSQIQKTVLTDDSFAFFNHVVYDGAAVDFAAISDDIKAPPMMADYKLIEWKYPSFTKMKSEDFEAFAQVLALLKEYDNVILLFLCGDGEPDLSNPKKSSSFVARFGEDVNIVKFDKKTSDNEVLGWLSRHFAAEGVNASEQVMRDLLFRSGHTLSVLNDEVIKLSLFVKANGRNTVTAKDVEEVASSTPECDTFALSNALSQRNKQAALLALCEMKLRRVDPIIIMSMIAKTMTELATVAIMLADGMNKEDITAAAKMNPKRTPHVINAARRFTKEHAVKIIEELLRVDTGAKYGGVTGYTAIELFITKCL